MAHTFIFYTRAEAQVFSSKQEAIDFYTRGAEQCDGSESDRYWSYVDALEESSNEDSVEYDYFGNVRAILSYDKNEDRLVKSV